MHRPPLALAFTTLERPQVAQRLIASIRKYRPEIKIYVVDQSRRHEAMAEFYRVSGVTVIPMPFDCGVTVSRNRLVEAITEEFFVLCDDDFILDANTDFTDAVRILEAEPQIGVVGGRLFDFYGVDEVVRSWELFLQYDKTNKILFSIPIYHVAPKARELGPIRYFLCDAVLNFAVFRRAIFAAGARWDERFKSNGEHEDFYLNLKVNTRFKVAYLPTLVAYHHHPEAYARYRSQLRLRNEGWRRFFDKWGLEQHLEYGNGVRTIDDLERVLPSSSIRERFFINPDVSLQCVDTTTGTLLIGENDNIAAVGALTPDGKRVDGFNDFGHLLLGPGVPPIALPAGKTEPAAATKSELAERYRLEAPVESTAVADPGAQLYFRYDPVWRDDADLYLWYYCVDPNPRDGAAQRRQVAVARWWDAGGQSLIWRSQQIFIDLRPSTFWQPLLLPVPVMTPGSPWLRFDIVTDAGPQSSPICTGLIFRQNPRAGAVAAPPDQPEVLALGRIPNDGVERGFAGEMLKDVIGRAPHHPVEPRHCSSAPALSLLDRDELVGLDVLYFVGWESLGRNLVSARLPRDGMSAPAALALPSADWSAPGREVLGFGASCGLVSLKVSQAGPSR